MKHEEKLFYDMAALYVEREGEALKEQAVALENVILPTKEMDRRVKARGRQKRMYTLTAVGAAAAAFLIVAISVLSFPQDQRYQIAGEAERPRFHSASLYVQFRSEYHRRGSFPPRQ